VRVPGSDREILLEIPGPPSVDEDSAGQVKELLAKGALGLGVIFTTEDCRGTYEELKAKGVSFVREPKEMPYGIEALMRDDSGNFFSLTQRHWTSGGGR
ncbi:MAG TPA: VOC family protein, partial [Kofleriaceae bacterium]|nr:VOC family protein [Kofleriaceae bacterium]